MSQRAAIPDAAMTITPGYSWRLDLDVMFNGVRPDDWPDWCVRMHVWGGCQAFSLTVGDGVRFAEVPDLHEADAPHVIPVIEMSAARTSMLRDVPAITYVIDLQAPGGEPEDYFAGQIKTVFAPPPELLG